MKTDRFTRTAAVVLAGLLLAASQPTDGQIVIRFGKGGKKKSAMAAALAGQVGEVLNQFEKNRRALRGVPGPDGQPVFHEEEVAGLIARTEQDLDQAIQQVGEPGLDALRAWVAEEFRSIQEEIAPPTGQTPHAVAVVASLERFSYASEQKTIPAETSNRLLDRAGEVASRIFLLAKKDDLKVKLWFGSTPERQATLFFWPKGNTKGATLAPRILQANEQRDGVMRGLYSYRAARGEGPVSELILYPAPPGAPEARPSEALNLVNESSFFCCQFNDHYCRHVENKKKCRP